MAASIEFPIPVWAHGALFSAGDGHAVQGDDEVCLTALGLNILGCTRTLTTEERQQVNDIKQLAEDLQDIIDMLPVLAHA